MKMNENENEYFALILRDVILNSRLMKMQYYIQHGNTSCLLHSIAVAYFANHIAFKLKFLSFHKSEIIRGALLHDYFLYDWHIPSELRWHGFKHPGIALLNAEQDFKLTGIEKDVIKKHMFPLTPFPPRYKESLLICLVDKYCSLYEIFNKNAYKIGKIRMSYNRCCGCS